MLDNTRNWLGSTIIADNADDIIISHYVTNFPEISRRAQDMYHNLKDADIMKNIFISGRYKDKVGMKIPAWMISEEMKHTEHYQMYVEVFGIDVPLTQSIKCSIHITPPAPVPTVDKADEMILQDTLQVSLAEHKSREEQEARENMDLVNEHLASVEIEKMVEGPKNVIDDSSIPRNDESNIPGSRLEPRSDKESPEVEIIKDKEVEPTNDEEVEITNVIIPVNVNDEEEEITDEVYELKRREKGKIVEESRSTPFPTPIRSPRIHTDLISSDTEKLQELTVTDTKTTSSSKSPSSKLKSFDTLADHLQEVMVESLPSMVDTHIKEQVKKQVHDSITNTIYSRTTISTVPQTTCRPFAVRPRDQDDTHDDAHPEGENRAKRQKTSKYKAYVSGESSSGQVNEEERRVIYSQRWKVERKFLSLHIRKTTPLVQSCQRDPEAPTLSLINQDLLYLKKGSSRPEKIVLSLHKFPAIIFNDDNIEERTSRWESSCEVDLSYIKETGEKRAWNGKPKRNEIEFNKNVFEDKVFAVYVWNGKVHDDARNWVAGARGSVAVASYFGELRPVLQVRSRGSDCDIPVVFSLIIALLRNKTSAVYACVMIIFELLHDDMRSSLTAKIKLASLQIAGVRAFKCSGYLVFCADVLIALSQPEFGYHGSSPLKVLILKNLYVVREFVMFPDELHWTSSGLERIEFGIELIPGAEPISKAPYRMAPVELKELKEQLQEMLENGFIRPSVLPWGAPGLPVFVKEERWELALVLLITANSTTAFLWIHLRLKLSPNRPNLLPVTEASEKFSVGLLAYYDVFVGAFSSRLALPSYPADEKGSKEAQRDDGELWAIVQNVALSYLLELIVASYFGELRPVLQVASYFD
ncbi:hypothetical protein Tco_0847542 [Tanacetum coccineum]